MRQKKLTPYERLEIARDIKRPKVTDYIDALFELFRRCDRRLEDDRAAADIAEFQL